MKAPRKGHSVELSQRRLSYLESQNISWHQHTTKPESLTGLIENHIGYLGLPIAIAGSCQINGTFAKGNFHIPLVALEGTLVLSMKRGFLATRLSGGINTIHIKQEISRSPCFKLTALNKIPFFCDWISDHFSEIKKQAESQTSHCQLLRIDTYPIQARVILDFVFYTAEAAGQNMITIGTDLACRWIIEQFKDQSLIDDFVIECNFNGDKNNTYRNMLLGRGHKVIAHTVIKEKILRRIMRIPPEEFVKKDKVRDLGSQLCGLMGHNQHVPNALSAIYLATGQDVACVTENSACIVTNELTEEGDLATSITLPSLTVGTVGGATGLPQQQHHLQLLGCQGLHSSKKLAEIIAASCLALELSLAASIGTNDFVAAHKSYGR